METPNLFISTIAIFRSFVISSHSVPWQIPIRLTPVRGRRNSLSSLFVFLVAICCLTSAFGGIVLFELFPNALSALWLVRSKQGPVRLDCGCRGTTVASSCFPLAVFVVGDFSTSSSGCCFALSFFLLLSFDVAGFVWGVISFDRRLRW